VLVLGSTLDEEDTEELSSSSLLPSGGVSKQFRRRHLITEYMAWLSVVAPFFAVVGVCFVAELFYFRW